MTNYSEWIDNWYKEAERLFNQLPSVPPELEPEIQKLLRWKAKTRTTADAYWKAKERLWQKRLERAEAQARIDAIVERQRIATEMEIAERHFYKWQREMERLKAEIDRICDHIIREMQRRHQTFLLEAAANDRAAHQKAEDDLRVWEAFKMQLDTPRNPAPEITYQEKTESERLRREYLVFQARESATEEENLAVWQAFIEEELNTERKQ